MHKPGDTFHPQNLGSFSHLVLYIYAVILLVPEEPDKGEQRPLSSPSFSNLTLRS